MRVLVVEDHRELAATIAVGLRREGMAVDIAFDGEDALRHAAGDSYEVILLDRDRMQDQNRAHAQGSQLLSNRVLRALSR